MNKRSKHPQNKQDINPYTRGGYQDEESEMVS